MQPGLKGQRQDLNGFEKDASVKIYLSFAVAACAQEKTFEKALVQYFYDILNALRIRSSVKLVMTLMRTNFSHSLNHIAQFIRSPFAQSSCVVGSCI